MKTKTDARIDQLDRQVLALEAAMDELAERFMEQVSLNQKLRALLEETLEKRHERG